MAGKREIRDKVIAYEVWYEGKDFIGTSTVDLPEIAAISDAVKGAGIAGEIEIPALGQISSMSTTLNFNTMEPGANKLNAPKWHMIDLRFVQQKFDASSGQLSPESVKITMKVFPKTRSGGSLEAGTAMGASLEMEVVYYKEVVAGKTAMEIDKLNMKYVVDGVDYYSEIRTGLGY